MYKEISKKMKEKEAAGGEAAAAAETGETPDFAKAIKRLRQDRKLSLEKLSESSGVHKQTLHSIENGSIRNPSFSNLEKIATSLHCTLNEILLLAQGEFRGNLYKTTASQRWTVSFESQKGFSIYCFSPPSSSRRDFFVGIMTIQGAKKLKHWQFESQAKACIQPWDGDILFSYHGMNWRREEHVAANETLYFDAAIPHSFENLSAASNRVLLVTYPSIF
jgi:XRE family transcriptional regulator, regulator of sulfur utilization